MKKIFLIPILLLVFTNCKKTNPVDPVPDTFTKTTVQYKTMAGIAPNLLSLDIHHYAASTQNRSVVIYVHGGGWRTGDKSNQLNNKLNLFSSLGYLFISINYRLSPDPSELNNPTRVKFPIHNDDVATAIKWIADNIHTYNGDASKMVVMGHSAGAHLVSLSGTSAVFLPGKGLNLTGIRGVASIDTEGYDVTDEMNNGTPSQKELYENAFGSNSTDWRNASPIAQIATGSTYPKFFIAKRGTPSRIASADAFINKLLSVGVGVSQVNGSQYDHDGINDAIGAPGETAITEPLKLFLKQCFQ